MLYFTFYNLLRHWSLLVNFHLSLFTQSEQERTGDVKGGFNIAWSAAGGNTTNSAKRRCSFRYYYGKARKARFGFSIKKKLNKIYCAIKKYRLDVPPHKSRTCSHRVYALHKLRHSVFIHSDSFVETLLKGMITLSLKRKCFEREFSRCVSRCDDFNIFITTVYYHRHPEFAREYCKLIHLPTFCLLAITLTVKLPFGARCL